MDVIVRKPPLAVQGIKEIVGLGALDTGFEEAREIEHRLSIKLMGSHDISGRQWTPSSKNAPRNSRADNRFPRAFRYLHAGTRFFALRRTL